MSLRLGYLNRIVAMNAGSPVGNSAQWQSHCKVRKPAVSKENVNVVANSTI